MSQEPEKSGSDARAVTAARRKLIFLEHLRVTGRPLHAAQMAGYNDTRVLRKARKRDTEFDEAWTEAQEDAKLALEDEATRRAVEGVEKPIYYRGMKVGSERQYSDQLLLKLLQANDPDKYADRKRVDGHVRHEVGVAVIPAPAHSDEEWERALSAGRQIEGEKA